MVPVVDGRPTDFPCPEQRFKHATHNAGHFHTAKVIQNLHD